MNSLKVKKPNFTKEVVLSAEELQLADKIQKLIDDTNATQLINAWEIGKLITEAYGDQKDYGSGQMENIAKRLNRSVKTLYRYKQMSELFDKESIDMLAKGKFSTPYSLVRAYGKKGAKKFMEIYQKATSLDDFKVRLEEQWPKSKTEKQTGTSEATVELFDNNTEESGDHSKIETDCEKSPAGDNSPTSSEKGLSPDPIEQTDDTPIDVKSDPKAFMDNCIKKLAGSALGINPLERKQAESPQDILETCLKGSSETNDDFEYIAKSELDKIRKENDDLKLENHRLRKDKEYLEQTIENLSKEYETQLIQNELVAA